MIDWLIEIGRCYGTEINVKKSKVMRISRQPPPIQILVDQKHPENMENFSYMSSMITNDATCIREIKYSSLNNKLFTRCSGLNLRKKLLSSAFGIKLCMALKLGRFGM